MMKRTAAGIFVPLATILLFLLATEGATRLVLDNGMQYDIEMWKYARELKERSSNPLIGHQHVNSRQARLMGADVSINSLGLRNAEIGQTKPSGVTRILMLGDSLTFGWGVSQKDTVARKIEIILNQNENAKKYQVINSGVGNYNTSMSVEYYRSRGHLLDSDLVILNYFINDAESTPVPPKFGFLNWSVANAYFYGRIDAVARMVTGRVSWLDYYRFLYRDGEPGWRVTKKSVSDLAAMTKASGTPLLLVNYPELRQLKPYPFAKVNAKIEELAESLGIPYFDLLPTVKELDARTLWVTVEDPHPNGVANAAFAEALVDTVRKRLAVD